MKHDVIRTPIDTLNILGAGGIKRGSIIQMWGPPKSGKSTFCYQTASFDMMDNEDCVLDIIDVENSTDLIRLKEAFHLDMDRVTIHHLSTLEDAFKLIIDSTEMVLNQRLKYIQEGKSKKKLASKEKLQKMSDEEFFSYCSDFQAALPPTLENDITYDKVTIKPADYGNDRERMMKALARAGAYYLPKGETIYRNVVWDTIAVSRPAAEFEKIAEGKLDKNAAGMNLASQVISTKLSACLSKMGGKTVTLFMPNQVRNKSLKGGMPGFKEGSYSSFALEHNCHYILKFRKVERSDVEKENYDEDDKGRKGTVFVMDIEKAKFCPATRSVELYINDKLGGVIIPKRELFEVGRDIGVVKKAGSGWFEIKGHEEELGKLRVDKVSNSGDSYIAGNPKVRKVLYEEVARHYRGCYNTLNILYEEAGKGEFGRPPPLSEDQLLEEEEDKGIMQSMISGIL